MRRVWCGLTVLGAAWVLWTGCDKQPGSGGSAQSTVVQVVAVAARRQPVAETLSLVGTLTANEMVELKSETDGVVQAIHFEEGQRVDQGQLLLQLDATKLAAAVGEAEASFKLGQANFDRAKQLLTDKLISQQEYDQTAATFDYSRATLELRERQLKDARIYAPFEGIVGARSVSPGQVITKNTTLTWLVDLDPVKVEVNVPERFLAQLQVGQPVEFPIAAYGNRKFKGEVYFVSPYVEEATRTALVKARLPNPDYELKPGMLATLDLTVQVRDDAVVIPEAALSQVLEGDQAMVYVVDQDHTVQLRQVRLGVRLAGLVELTAGMQGGEQVIVEGIQKVGPGAKVRLAPPEAAAPYLPASTRTNRSAPSVSGKWSARPKTAS